MLTEVDKEYVDLHRQVKAFGKRLIIPVWSKYLAVDNSGEIWAYSTEPVMDSVSLSSWVPPSSRWKEVFQELVGYFDKSKLKPNQWSHLKLEVTTEKEK